MDDDDVDIDTSSLHERPAGRQASEDPFVGSRGNVSRLRPP
jgi:hypothetical protein